MKRKIMAAVLAAAFAVQSVSAAAETAEPEETAAVLEADAEVEPAAAEAPESDEAAAVIEVEPETIAAETAEPEETAAVIEAEPGEEDLIIEAEPETMAAEASEPGVTEEAPEDEGFPEEFIIEPETAPLEEAVFEELPMEPALAGAEIAIDRTVFPDAVFCDYVKRYADKDKNGSLSAEEIARFTVLDLYASGVSDLTGIQYLTALTEIDCGDNQLTSLDVSKNTALTLLRCDNNQLTSLNISGCKNLLALQCEKNRLTHLETGFLDLDSKTADGQPKVNFSLGGQFADAELQRVKGGWLLDMKTVTGSEYAGNIMAVSKVEGMVQDNDNMTLMFPETGVPKTINYIYMAAGPNYVQSRSDTLMQITLTLRKAPCSHVFGEYSTVKKPTPFKEGLAVSLCTICGEAQTKTLEKVPGTIELTDSRLPLQVKKSVSLKPLVTGMQEGDAIKTCRSDNTAVAAVTDSGKITGKKTGTATITVTLKSGASAELTVAVQKSKVKTSAITGLKESATVTVGKKLTLKPRLSPISSQDKITYSSANKKIATVTSKGVVKGIKAGTARITVKAGGKKSVVKVKVTAPAVKKIKNVPAKKTIKKGKTYQLSPKCSPAGSKARLKYKSSNSKVASVSAGGKIKAKKKGTATITVTAGKVTAKCKVTVK